MNTKYRISPYILGALLLGSCFFCSAALSEENANPQSAAITEPPATAEIALGKEPPLPPPPIRERLRERDRDQDDVCPLCGNGNFCPYCGKQIGKLGKREMRGEAGPGFFGRGRMGWRRDNRPGSNEAAPGGPGMRRGLDRNEPGPGREFRRRFGDAEETGPGRGAIPGGRILGAVVERHPDWAKAAREKIGDGVPPREVAQELLEKLSQSDDPKDREFAEQIKKFREERFGGRGPAWGRREGPEGKEPVPPFAGRERMRELREKFRNADSPEQREKIQTELHNELEKRFQDQAVQLKEQMERLENRMKELLEKRDAVISEQEKEILSKN